MTNENKYAPPIAAVADAPELRALADRPKQVRLAVAMLWISLALGVPSWYLGAARDPEANYNPVVVVITALLFALCVFLNTRIYHGKNWARIATLGLTLLALLAVLIPVDAPSPPSGLENALFVLMLSLEFVAMYLVFTKPGALWFRNPR